MQISEFAKNLGFKGIYAVTSKEMFKIVKKSGWEIELRQQGKSEKKKEIYLIVLPTSEASIMKLRENLKNKLLELNQK